MQIYLQKSFFYLTFDFDCPIFINKESRKKRSHVAQGVMKQKVLGAIRALSRITNSHIFVSSLQAEMRSKNPPPPNKMKRQ